MDKSVVAIIPAKAFSRRVPGKNMRHFNGKPLLYYTVVQLSLERNSNVLSVTPTGRILAHFRTFDDAGRLQVVDPEVGFNFQSQDRPEVYCINGAVYCAPVVELLQQRTFQYGNPVGF